MGTRKQMEYASDLVLKYPACADEMQYMLSSGNLCAPGLNRTDDLSERSAAAVGDSNYSMASYLIGRLLEARDR